MNTPREFQALHAEHRAREALAQARSTLERALRELDRYTARFDEAESLRDKADVMNWTLNELACNITPNLRLDLIASAQAELVRADTMESGPPSQAQKDRTGTWLPSRTARYYGCRNDQPPGAQDEHHPPDPRPDRHRLRVF